LKKAEEEFTKLLEAKQPMAEVEGLIGMMCLRDLQGRFVEFLELAEQAVNKSKDMDNFIYEFYLLSWQAQHCSRYRQSEKAWEAIEKMRDLSHKRDSLWMDRLLLFTEGVHYVYIGSLEKAAYTADALREVIDQGLNTKEIRRFYLLIGLIDRKRENHSKAIEYYDKAIELYPAEVYEVDTPILSVFRKAESLFTMGNLDDAREEFEKILRMTFGRRNYGSFYAKSFYMLGKIYEQIGNEAKAREYFEKFLDLWKDADPGRPEVEDAKSRLAELQN
jgi:tetratricopeptide (TPR) repeat protein